MSVREAAEALDTESRNTRPGYISTGIAGQTLIYYHEPGSQPYPRTTYAGYKLRSIYMGKPEPATA